MDTCSRLAAIIFNDTVGYTALMQESMSMAMGLIRIPPSNGSSMPAYTVHELEMIWLKVDPMFRSMDGDQRYQDFLARVGFP